MTGDSGSINRKRRPGRRLPLTALVALFAGTAACGGEPSQPSDTATLRGQVVEANTDVPLSGAVVSVAGRSDDTDANGRYAVDGIPLGRHLVTITHTGHAPLNDSLVVVAPGVIDKDYQLGFGLPIPSAPQRLTAASGPTAGTVQLSWEPMNMVRVYNLYWSTSPGVTPVTGTRIAGVVSPYLHEGLTPGTPYYYVLTAAGDLGESPPSPEVQAVARGPIAVTIEAPGDTGFVGVDLGVSVTVNSVFQLSEVTARVGDVSSPLTFDSGSRAWRAVLSLAALASPADYVLVVTARDIQGAIGSSSRSVRFDRAPVFTVAAPATGALATPVLSVDVSCSDDDPGGCHGIEIRETGASGLIGSSQGPRINQGISLAAYEGQQLTLEFSAEDNVGQRSTFRRFVVVESSPGLSQVATAGSGFVVDADADRLLVVNPGIFGIGYDTLRLLDRSSGGADTVFTADSTLIQEARLTPVGAIFVTKPLNGLRELRELRNGSVAVVSSPISFDSLLVDGAFAVWTEEASSSTRRVVRRDLLAGTNLVVPPVAPTTPLDEGDPAPSGDVALSGRGDIFLFTGGSTERLTQHSESGPYNFFPRTDGVHLVYLRSTTFFSGPAPIETVLDDDSGGTVLASTSMPSTTYSGYPEFQLRGGWIAFTRPGTAQVAQVWLRSPAGIETQISQFGVGSGIAALSDAGNVVFVSYATGPSRLYRAAAGVSAHDFGSAVNRPIYIDGSLYLMAGASLLRVN